MTIPTPIVVLGSKPQLATTEKLVSWASRVTGRNSCVRNLDGDCGCGEHAAGAVEVVDGDGELDFALVAGQEDEAGDVDAGIGQTAGQFGQRAGAVFEADADGFALDEGVARLAQDVERG